MDKSVQTAIDYLNLFSTKLTPFAKNIFEAYKRQVFVDGITTLIGSLLLAIIAFSFVFMFKYLVSDQDKAEKTDFYIVMKAIMIFGFIIFIILALKQLILGIEHFRNPLYYIVQKILQNTK